MSSLTKAISSSNALAILFNVLLSMFVLSLWSYNILLPAACQAWGLWLGACPHFIWEQSSKVINLPTRQVTCCLVTWPQIHGQTKRMLECQLHGSGLKGEVMHRLQASPTVYTPFYLTYLRTIPEGSSYEWDLVVLVVGLDIIYNIG